MFGSETPISRSLTPLAAPPHLSERNVEWARLAGLDDGSLEIEGETDEATAVKEFSDLERDIQARFESSDAAGLIRLLIIQGPS